MDAFGGQEIGSSLPPNIRSRSNTINIIFSTDGSDTKTGWSFSWSAETPPGCALDDTFLTWHNGEPIGKRQGVGSAEECETACKGTTGCAAWTLNTENGACLLKSSNQIRPTFMKGVKSGILDPNSEFCSSD